MVAKVLNLNTTNGNGIAGNRIFAEGEIVSNDTRATGLNNNDLIIGGSGSGKTGTYIYNLLLNPCGSLVVSDTKGLLCKKFTPYLKEKGYKVHTIDFVNPEKSVAYNPLKCIRQNSNGGFNEMDIRKLATAIMPSKRSQDPFWEKAAARYIGMLIGFVLESYPEEEQTMTSVVSLNYTISDSNNAWIIEDWVAEHPDSFSAKRYKMLKRSLDSEKMWGSIYEFVNEGLEIFDYEELRPIFGNANSIDIANIGKEKTVLFLNSSDNDSSFYRLCDIFYLQALQTLIAQADQSPEGRLSVPCRIVLDDFAAASKIEEFENIISIIRSREISVSVIIQSISQLSGRYNKDNASTIINNCDHILFLKGAEPDTTKFISYHMNKPVAEILKKPDDMAVLITAGKGAKYVHKLVPYAVEPICKSIVKAVDAQLI